ncbi:DUF3093 domain-containing protein [Aeromicrobium sp.]|uniref:DUF3093 domain-containing protein n=1 Tax=Aeromicrobium sp. TaxID=1871063 RepID=UPI00198757D0|nr:DUF3093 domain-containing protein [Aeromicrobium sp.]MBC7630858.1 DUF3093 domain-containing protein [Aeromicrobium sp.]
MTPYRERLTAPVSWWIAAATFGLVWGWIMLVVTTWQIAVVTTLLVAAAGFFAVSRYGSLLIEVKPDGLTVGRASLAAEHLGAVEQLNRVDYRHRLGVGADARAYLVTRPYVDRGVVVGVTDERDPVPYWLVSSRHPDALAVALGMDPTPRVDTALGQNGAAPQTSPALDTTGEATRGKEA